MSNTADQRERIKELFAHAMSVGPAARLAVLDEGCAGDSALRKAVEDLIENYASAQEFFAQFPEDFAHAVLSVRAVPRAFSTGDTVAGRFHIAGFLGAGGMGEVYEAEDLLLNERVALKTLPLDIAGDARAIARLKREMALARQVTHLNVCRVFDVDQHVSPSGAVIAFFTMELLKGETLAARLQRSGPLSATEAWPLVRQMAAALGTAHAVGIVHGDFKPGNVVLVPSADGGERLVVTDFGLARRASTDAPRSVNSSGAGWGTPVYMAPEQFGGRGTTRATDMYALAAVLFEMVTGKRVVEAHAEDSPASSALDPHWRVAILRCLDHNPEARFQTVGELLNALGAADSRSGARWRWAAVGSRWRWAVGSACLSVALLLLVPAVRVQLAGTLEGAGVPLYATQQSIAVLASTGPDRTPDAETFSRGLAAAIADQLGTMSEYKPQLLFVPTGEMVGTGVNSPIRAQRTLGADLMVTVGVDGAMAPRHITIELHRASARQPTLMGSRRVEIGDGDRILQLVRTEVAQMLAMRLARPAIRALDAGGTWPAEAEEWYVRGRGSLEQGRAPRLDAARLDLAITAFQETIALDGQYAPARAALGEALVLKYEATKDIKKDTQLLDQAERSADEGCRLQPNLAHCHLVRALAYLATGRHELAIPSLEEALRLDPDAVGARENLAKSYAATARLPRAEETLEEAIRWHPQSWSAHEDLGVFRVNQGQYKEAETHFLAGRRHAPDNRRVIINLAALYTVTELFDAAEQELIRGVQLAPDPLLYNNLGWAYFYQGDFTKGVDSMKKAVSLTNNDSIVLAGLARGYRWMARQDDADEVSETAIATARKHISADPKDAVVRANLAYLYAETGDHGEAGRQIERALEDAPGNARVRFTSALVLELTGQRQAALDALQTAMEGGHPKYQIAHHPDLKNLRADDRYGRLVGRVAWKR
jgi:tetratricopeptide (TPR) repeat protein